MKSFSKKTIISLIAISLLSSGFIGFAIPKAAEAADPVPTEEKSTRLQTNIATISDIEGANFAQVLKEWAETLLNTTLKKKLLDFLVDQVISYINGDGGGGFVANWEEFLSGVAGDTIREFGLEVADIDLCSPFSAQLKLNFSRPPVQSFSQRAACTLDDIVGNIQNFADDFSNGGWLAYNEAWQPNNNFVGVSLTAALEQSGRVSRAKGAALSELSAGAGFTGARECSEDPNSNGKDIDGDGVNGDISSTCKIITPGSTVGKLVDKAIGSDIDYIVGTDVNLGTYVSAIVNAAMNRVLTEGLNMVSSINAGSGSAPSGSGNINNYIDSNLLGITGAEKITQDAAILKLRIQEAIDARKDGQQIFDNDSTDLILTNAETALSGLEYVKNELLKVTRTSQLKNRSWGVCQPYRSVNIVRRKQVPIVEFHINNISAVIKVIEESTRVTGISPNETVVKYLEDKIDNINNVLSDLASGDQSDESFLSDLTFKLLAIENGIVPNNYKAEAATYLQDIKDAKASLFNIYASFHGYTGLDENFVGALDHCFDELIHGGVVVQFSSRTIPSIPFPWEGY